MHRLILNPPEGFLCDHINHNGLDNRRENLRIVTPCENTRNQLKQNKRRNTSSYSQYKGVTRHGNYFTTKTCSYPWAAQINSATLGHMYLGSFATEEEAAVAYDKKAREWFGEYACCNFPEGHTVVAAPRKHRRERGYWYSVIDDFLASDKPEAVVPIDPLEGKDATGRRLYNAIRQRGMRAIVRVSTAGPNVTLSRA